MTRADLLEQLAEAEAVVLPHEYDPALAGIGQQFNRVFALYDRAKVIEIIRQQCGEGSHEGAEEFFEFNVRGAYVGEGTPAFVEMLD